MAKHTLKVFLEYVWPLFNTMHQEVKPFDIFQKEVVGSYINITGIVMNLRVHSLELKTW